MVKLLGVSSIDAKSHPFLHEWDKAFRENHAKYQTQIDKVTYHLQRAQRGLLFFGSWNYPTMYQRDVQLLDLYKKKQQVGRVFQNEVDSFRKVNPNIADDLNHTFFSKFLIPWKGAAVGGGSFVVAHLLNFHYSFRVGFLIIPIAVEVVLNWTDKSPYARSGVFLNWLIEYRKAKGRLEYDGHRFDTKTYRENIDSSLPVQDLYNNLIDLVTQEKL
jgi:hypothetical protein